MIHWQRNRTYDILIAQHSGYKRLNDPVEIKRGILFDKINGQWIIWDRISSRDKHHYKFPFHFSQLVLENFPDWPNGIIARASDNAYLLLCPMQGPGLKMELGQSWISLSYGIRKPAPLVEYTCDISSSHDVIWGILVGRRMDNTQRVDIRRLQADQRALELYMTING